MAGLAWHAGRTGRDGMAGVVDLLAMIVSIPVPDRSAVRDRAVVTDSAAWGICPAISGTSTASPLPNSDRARAMTASTSAQVCMSDMHQ
jgi:hypothetical protein